MDRKGVEASKFQLNANSTKKNDFSTSAESQEDMSLHCFSTTLIMDKQNKENEQNKGINFTDFEWHGGNKIGRAHV